MKPFDSIRWKAWLRTSDPTKAKKLADRLIEALDCQAHDLKLTKYDHDPEYHTFVFRAELRARSIQEAIFNALQMAGRLAYHWEVGRPQEFSDERWSFAGSLFKGRFRVPGVESVEFELQNFD